MKNKLSILFLFFVLTMSLFSATTHAQNRCADLFKALAPGQRVERQQQTEVSDLKTFGQAMTEGMILRPDQVDLFEIYRKIFFGDPKTSVNDATLKTVTDILKVHPELAKPHFREYEIETVQKVYETPESLAKHLKSQNGNAGQVRSNLFQVEANLGFWKKLMGYDPKMPENLSKDQKREFQEQVKARFLRYLDRIISKENRDLLKDEKADYKLKIKALFSVLKRMSEHMEKRGHDNKALRQAMVDLVATSGFNNQATQGLLKSKNALDKIEGLKKVLDERDTMAMELGFAGHFEEILRVLQIDSPSLSNKSIDDTQLLGSLERERY